MRMLLLTMLCCLGLGGAASANQISDWRAGLGLPAVADSQDPAITALAQQTKGGSVAEGLLSAPRIQEEWQQEDSSGCRCSLPAEAGNIYGKWISEVLSIRRPASRWESWGVAGGDFASAVDGNLPLRVFAADPDLLEVQQDQVGNVTLYTFRYTLKPTIAAFVADPVPVDLGTSRGVPFGTPIYPAYDLEAYLWVKRRGRWQRSGDAVMESVHGLGNFHGVQLYRSDDWFDGSGDDQYTLTYDSEYKITGVTGVQPTLFRTEAFPRAVLERKLRFTSTVPPATRRLVLAAIARMDPGFRRLVDQIDGQLVLGIGSRSQMEGRLGLASYHRGSNGERGYTINLRANLQLSRLDYSNLIAHELTHVLDFAGFEGYREFVRAARRSPRYRGCFRGSDSTANSPSCVPVSEYFADHVARYASGGWGGHTGYGVPFMVSPRQTGQLLQRYWYPAP